MKKNGFTLIELMITVAIVAILAAIAYPSYQDSVMKTRRGIAQSELMEAASFMERYFTENNTYVGATLPATISSDFYGYSFSATPTATAYTVRAIPTAGSSQASDTCGTMTLTQTGATTPTTSGCWQ